MPYVTVETEIAVHAKCANCGAELEVSDAVCERGKITVSVLACEACIDEACDETEAYTEYKNEANGI